MPTKKHRYTVTGDEEIELALKRRRNDFSAGTPASRILATLIVKGDKAIEEEKQNEGDYEQRRRAAAERLAARFRRSDGFDYEALEEASDLWLGE